jgi:hypothetical protein
VYRAGGDLDERKATQVNQPSARNRSGRKQGQGLPIQSPRSVIRKVDGIGSKIVRLFRVLQAPNNRNESQFLTQNHTEGEEGTRDALTSTV